jgi:hypothetical protein
MLRTTSFTELYSFRQLEICYICYRKLVFIIQISKKCYTDSSLWIMKTVPHCFLSVSFTRGKTFCARCGIMNFIPDSLKRKYKDSKYNANHVSILGDYTFGNDTCRYE